MTARRLNAIAALLGGMAVLLISAEAGAQNLFGLWSRDQALHLVRHDVQVSIEHPVAATTVVQEFENPHAFNLEAFFHYPVPAGATVSGLALWVNGERREARMLERQKAREIYDGIVRQKRDPALLERLDGNTFRIRIFPVLARSRTRVELRFVQPVEQDGPGRYQVTLRRPPGQVLHVLRLGVRLSASVPLEELALEGHDGRFVSSSGALVLAMPAAARSFRRDIHLRYRVRGAGVVAAATTHDKERVFVAELPARPQAAVSARRVAVLLDASTTMAPHLRLARELVEQVLGGLSAADELALVPFDLLPRAPAALSRLDAPARAAARRLLVRTEARGGTAFVPAFEAAIAAGARQIICITDGGSRLHIDELEHLARTLYDRPGLQVSVIATPGSTAEEPLRDLAAVGGGHYQRLEARADLGAAARRLLQGAARPQVRLQGSGAIHVLQHDAGRLMVTGAVPAAQRAVVIETGSGLDPVTVALPGDAAGDGRPLGALYAAAAIDAQMRRIKLLGETRELRAAIVRLSQEHNVVSEYTALLATETDADYLRPTSGRQWQRMTPKAADDLPSTFQSTPEPHEWALIGLGLTILWLARRRRPGPASRAA